MTKPFVKKGTPSELHKKLDVLRNQDSENGWVEIKDPVAIDLIMSTFAVHLNRKMIKVTIDVPRTIMDILRFSGVQQSTGYRKILDLIKNQILVPYDTVQRHGGKRVTRYISAIKSLQMEINDFNEATVKAKLSSRTFF